MILADRTPPVPDPSKETDGNFALVGLIFAPFHTSQQIFICHPERGDPMNSFKIHLSPSNFHFLIFPVDFHLPPLRRGLDEFHQDPICSPSPLFTFSPFSYLDFHFSTAVTLAFNKESLSLRHCHLTF